MNNIKIISESLEINDKNIDYTIEFSTRKTLLIMAKKTTGEIVVKSPQNLSMSYIKSFIESKASWIEKQIKKIETDTSFVKVNYENGSTHMILGMPYTLEIHSAQKTDIFTASGKLIVNCRSNLDIEKALLKWYAQISPVIFSKIMRPIIDKFGEKYNIYPSKVEYKYVKRYWGQCTSKRLIRININLIHQPQTAIEYIIVHELCHLIHQNHSSKFWDLVEKEMPDYRERKKLLTNYY